MQADQEKDVSPVAVDIQIKEETSEIEPTLVPHPTRKHASSSNLQASLTLFKSFIGTGVLALPYAYKTAGVTLSIIMTVIISSMLCYCFLLLLETANDKVGKSKISFPKLARDILGIKGKYVVQSFLLIEQLCCCIGIIIFTKDFLNHILCSFEIDSLCGNTAFNLVFSLALTVPLSLINNMHYFYIPSMAANFFIMIALLSQMFYNVESANAHPEVKSHFVSNFFGFHITQLPVFFGVAVFSFEGVGVTFSIRDSMEKPEALPKILKSQMVVITAIYIVFSSVSALALGDKLEDIVFFSLPTSQPFYLLIQILYAVSALFTYPIQLFPAIRIMENSKFLRMRLFNEKGRTRNKYLRYGLRLFMIGCVFLIAYLTKSFHLFLGLIGSCIMTTLGFGLPIWLYMAQFKDRIPKKKKYINYGILGFIIFFGSFAFIISLRGLVDE